MVKHLPKLFMFLLLSACAVVYSYINQENKIANKELANKAKSMYVSLGIKHDGFLLYEENTANLECNRSTYSAAYAINDLTAGVCSSMEKTIINAGWRNYSACRIVEREKQGTRPSFSYSVLDYTKKYGDDRYLINAAFFPRSASHPYFTPFSTYSEHKIIALTKSRKEGFYYIEITYMGPDHKFRRNCREIIVSDEPCECIYKTYKSSKLFNENERVWFD